MDASKGPLESFTQLGEISTASRDAYGEVVPPNLLRIWDELGAGYVGDGFLRIVDPVTTVEKLRPVANAGGPWVPIMTTALGDVVYLVQGTYVFATFYRYGFTDIIHGDPAEFVASIETMATLDGRLRRSTYPERAAETGIPGLDQCYAYVPLLALGGPEVPSHLDLSDMWIHLQLLVQLAGTPEDVWRTDSQH